MDFNHIQYFVTVAQTLNFRETARRMKVAQSSVSRAISEMERQLEVKLFVRGPRSIALTDAGKAYLPYAMDIMSSAQKGAFAAMQAAQGNGKHISIAVVSTSTAILQECLVDFSAKYPEVAVDIAYNSGSEESAALSENQFDFFFCHQSMLPQDNRLDYLVTHVDTLVFVVPKGHPMAGKPLDFSALESERFIGITKASGSLLYDQIDRICMENNYHPRVVTWYDKAESVLLSVAAGLGIAILPKVLPSVFWPEDVEIVPIPRSNTERRYIVAWPKATENPSSKLFLNVVQKRFGTRSD